MPTINLLRCGIFRYRFSTQKWAKLIYLFWFKPFTVLSGFTFCSLVR